MKREKGSRRAFPIGNDRKNAPAEGSPDPMTRSGGKEKKA